MQEFNVEHKRNPTTIYLTSNEENEFIGLIDDDYDMEFGKDILKLGVKEAFKKRDFKYRDYIFKFDSNEFKAE